MSNFTELVARLHSSKEEELNAVLTSLNSIIYPLDGLQTEHSNAFFKTILQRESTWKPLLVTKWTHLIHTLLTNQKASLTPDVANDLFMKILSLLSQCPDPVEPLYAMSALVVHTSLPSQVAEGLVVSGSPLYVCMMDEHIPVQRAALDCLSSLCHCVDLSPLVLNGLLEVLLQLLNQSIKPHPHHTPLLHTKLQFSILRTLHNILGCVGSIQPLPLLPSLLATLKALMTLGLPGHSIQRAPIPLSPHPDTVAVSTVYQSPSVAGPRQKRQRKRGAGSNRSKEDGSLRATSSSISLSTSEGESGGEGGGEGVRRGRGAREGGRPKRSGRSDKSSGVFTVSTTSESDQSEGDSSVNNSKDVTRRIRLSCLMCLSTIFQSLDRHTAFAYGLPFLPDSPRPPSSPPTLLTCLCKDPMYKCRSAAAAVLNSVIEGSRSFMAVADDRPAAVLPFTPYSKTLGGVVQELHRNLLVSITTEHHPLTLTHVLKCLSILIINAPYRTLSKHYIRSIVTAIKPLTMTTDTDVAVGALTCYGAILSLNPPVGEVEVWLNQEVTSDKVPWIFSYCLSLVKSPGTAQSLQMEAIQVLTAIVKFNFHSIRLKWEVLSLVYCDFMCAFLEPLQQHSLRYLEELGRALCNERENDLPLASVVNHWERIMGGPLTRWLQGGDRSPSPCAQACSVLATMGNGVLEALKAPTRVLVLTVLLGLSRDDNSSIKSSAMRSLGVFCQYSCLSDDPGFLMDCRDRIREGLASNQQLVVRTQAGWAVGNLTDSFHSVESRTEVLPLLFPSLVDCAVLAMKDNEKVKVNAVRASGNLLKILNLEVLSNNVGHVTIMCSLLTDAVNNGGMKTRWNACYACHNALSNECFTSHYKQCIQAMLEGLCTAVSTCKNFKVRTNAALALSSLVSFPSHEELVVAWNALLKAADSTVEQHDFAEYKQANALKKQLCQSLLQLILLIDDSVLPKMSSLPSLPQCLNTQLVQCMHESIQHQEKEGSLQPSTTTCTTDFTLSSIVSKAHEALKKLNCDLLQESKCLNDIFKILEL